jgi:hypothetical protein
VAFLGLLIGVHAAQSKDFAFESYPVKSMRYVEEHGLLGTRLLTSDSDAGYVILHYYPEQKVFIDDRYDMYPSSVIYDFFTVADGERGWAKVLDRYDVETVVWARDSRLGTWLDASTAWKRVHRDSARAVWVRSRS